MIYIKAYTTINFGDDLLIKLLCDNNKDKEFCIICDDRYQKVFENVKNLHVMSDIYDYLKDFKHDRELYIKEYNNQLKKISTYCDTFIYVGGSIFMETAPTSIDRVRQLKDEISMFKYSYITGANFGPYITEDYYKCIHDEIIPMLTRISFRDKYSYDKFKDLNNVIYAPDIVFSLPVGEIKKEKQLGISLIHEFKVEEKYQCNYDNYINKLLNLSYGYIKNGYTVKLLSFCSHEKDDIAIENFLSNVNPQYKKYFSTVFYSGDILNFLNEISSLDTIIATRFHAKVLGLKYLCNLIPICYSVKSNHLLNDLGVENYADFSNLSNLNIINLKDIKQLEIDSKKHLDI